MHQTDSPMIRLEQFQVAKNNIQTQLVHRWLDKNVRIAHQTITNGAEGKKRTKQKMKNHGSPEKCFYRLVYLRPFSDCRFNNELENPTLVVVD